MKSCSTCEHRKVGICMYSGYSCTTERKFPTRCDYSFSGWIPRRGMKQRLINWWKGV